MLFNKSPCNRFQNAYNSLILKKMNYELLLGRVKLIEIFLIICNENSSILAEINLN